MKKNKKLLEDVEQFDLLIGLRNIEEPNYDEINTTGSERGIEEIEVTLNNTEVFYFIKESEFFDVITVDFDANPALAVEQFKKIPTIAIKKVIPIDLVVPTTKEIILKNVMKLTSQKIGNNESFAVKCELRNNGQITSSDELINHISTEIIKELKYDYNEKNAQWIIIIEELGKITGIGINKAQDMLIN